MSLKWHIFYMQEEWYRGLLFVSLTKVDLLKRLFCYIGSLYHSFNSLSARVSKIGILKLHFQGDDNKVEIRRAKSYDIVSIEKLLEAVLTIHHNKRPDIFKGNTKKYTNSELTKIIGDDSRPVFVAVENDNVLGYAFCIFQKHEKNNILTDIKTLYIDDLCVDKAFRKKHIGKKLYEYVLEFARKSDCYNVTLNVWACNEEALGFYEKMGLAPQKIGMEKILD